MPTPRARLEWARRVQAEYRSAATTARVLHWMIQCGLPRPLLDKAQRIVSDELDHAELSLPPRRAGWDVQAVDLDVAELSPPTAPEGPLVPLRTPSPRLLPRRDLRRAPVRSNAPHTTHPEASAALERILRDEAVHRAFG